MADLKTWLHGQKLTIREFALDLDVPLKTVQDWVYRGVEPSAENQDRIAKYITSHCAHYWVIAVPNGPISEGVCQRCGNLGEFQNSAPDIRWPASTPPGNSTASASPPRK
ncbi:MAG: helix-turn-helix transcriptional regulator [Chloroflexi bacterium]|nr:helix-turn-helix transcriptional regulator [Chloroflexota bacterium]